MTINTRDALKFWHAHTERQRSGVPKPRTASPGQARAQSEVAALLRRIGSTHAGLAEPHARPAFSPLDKDSVQFSRDAPESAMPRSLPMNEPRGADRPAKAAAAFALRPTKHVLVVGAIAATSVLLLFGTDLALNGKIGTLDRRVASLETSRGALDAVVKMQLQRQDLAIAALAKQFSDVRRPPSAFVEAGDMFSAGRYIEAEARYGRLLLEMPDGALTPVILSNSALANALSGNCAMARARLDTIQARFPIDPILASRGKIAAACGNSKTPRQGKH